MKIKQKYTQTTYIETDDICNFLKYANSPLYQMIEILNAAEDEIFIDSLLDHIFEVVLTIYEKIENKTDILEEFNVINSILEDYDPNSGLRYKLSTLKQIHKQCKIYASRPLEGSNIPKRPEADEKITREDYNFLIE